MEDLRNATIEDVKAFHKKYYIPNNATLVVSGDFIRDSVKAMIEKYYGEIPAGENIPDPTPMNITLNETKKLYHEDNFARTPQYTMVFPTCEQFSKDAYSLNVLAQLLGRERKLRCIKYSSRRRILHREFLLTIPPWNLRAGYRSPSLQIRVSVSTVLNRQFLKLSKNLKPKNSLRQILKGSKPGSRLTSTTVFQAHCQNQSSWLRTTSLPELRIL